MRFKAIFRFEKNVIAQMIVLILLLESLIVCISKEQVLTNRPSSEMNYSFSVYSIYSMEYRANE